MARMELIEPPDTAVRAKCAIRMIRTTCLVSAASVLSACATAAASDDSSLAATAAIEVTPASLRRCLDDLEGQARSQNVPLPVFRRYTANLEPDPVVIDKLNFQPEFISSVSAYLKAAVSDERIRQGRDMMQRHQRVLNSVSSRYGVAPEYLVAVWGVESNYGQNFGSRPVLRSLATLACHGRRQGFFRTELFATLKIINAGHVKPDQLVGSWAGAFGHTQFMPTTFLSRAVDHNGDGKRDLLGNLGDALASTANYLKKSGWQDNLPWGIEVTAPDGLTIHADTRKNRQSLARWQSQGVKVVRRADAQRLARLPSDTPAALVRPADNAGPVLMVFSNFDALHAYNPSIKYSLAVATLGDRIARRPPLTVAWPDTGKPLTRDERRELQQRLLDRGHRIGKVDGILGARTRAAIRKERRRLSDPDQAGNRPVLMFLRNGSG